MAKVTKFKFPPFTKLMNPGLRIYPGAFIPVGGHYDILIMDDVVTDQAKPLPPGVPLDEDIANAIFQTLSWYSEWKELESYESINDVWIRNIEVSYMEAVYRWIKQKKDQSCLGI